MGIISKTLQLCARPQGKYGTLWLKMMNLSHTPFARWHLLLIDWHDDWTVLDEGCGGGKNIARMLKLCPKGKVYGIDYAELSVKTSRQVNAKQLGKRCFIEQGNAMSLNFPDENFNIVTAFETVFFWPDLKQCFGETYRVLKPGGKFMFTYGDAESKAYKHWTMNIDAMYLLSIEQLTAILTQVGFSDIKVLSKSGTYNIQGTK